MGLGEILREARLYRDLTLEGAERATRVRRVFLVALEAERYDLLPAKVYTQGFLQVYARYLGLDARPLLQLLPTDPVPPPPAPRKPVAPSLILTGLVSFIGLFALALGGLYLYQEATTAVYSVAPLVVDFRVAANPIPRARAASVSGSLAVPTPRPVSRTPTPTPTPFVSVSSVTGMQLSSALQTLQVLGLNVVSEERWSTDVPRGTVVAQKPPPGEPMQQGATVTVIVSKGLESPLVPDVVGQEEAEARRLLSEAGLVPARYANYQGQTDLPEDVLGLFCLGCVLSSTPQPGAQVSRGTEVFLVVRKE